METIKCFGCQFCDLERDRWDGTYNGYRYCIHEISKEKGHNFIAMYFDQEKPCPEWCPLLNKK